MTRARSTLLLTGSWFRDGKSALPPSRFLTEPYSVGQVADMPLTGARPGRRRTATRRHPAPSAWAPRPADDVTNPALEEEVTALWPVDPLGARRPRLEAAAAAVRAAAERQRAHPLGLDEPDRRDDDAARWLTDARLLLAERDAAGEPRAGGPPRRPPLRLRGGRARGRPARVRPRPPPPGAHRAHRASRAAAPGSTSGSSTSTARAPCSTSTTSPAAARTSPRRRT